MNSNNDQPGATDHPTGETTPTETQTTTRPGKWQAVRRRLPALCIFAVVGFAFVSYIVGSLLVAPANRPVDAPDDLPLESLTLPSESGSDIATWYCPPQSADQLATVVLVHPIRGDRGSMLSRARLLHQSGFTTVMIDLQAHGASPGDNITIGHLESHDVRAAVEFARQRNPDHKVAVLGISLGGASTLLAGPLEIDALVLESVYATISEAVHNRVSAKLGPLAHVVAPVLLWQLPMRLGISSSDLRPIDHIGKFDCPILVASGELDHHTPPAEAQRIYAAAAESEHPVQKNQLVIFAGAAHEDLLDHDTQKYNTEVLGFLKQALAR